MRRRWRDSICATGAPVLYDLSSSYVERRSCELARFGHPRDDRPDKMQIVFGFLCSAAGCPIAAEVFEGNTGDPSTLGNQIASSASGSNGWSWSATAGGSPMARIDEELKPAGLDWITALLAPAIQHLAAEGGPLHR